MGKTSIQWTDMSLNPFRARNRETGKCGHFCVKISPGCKFCYSSRSQPRFGTFPFLAENRDKVELFLDQSKLEDVMRRKIPTKYFWCDMTDMFLEDYPDEWIDKCFAAMALTPWHTHQVLTKRAGRLLGYLSENCGHEARRRVQDLIDPSGRDPSGEAMKLFDGWPLPNVWLGVSVEDQPYADDRISHLLKTPAAVRFVSYEPALEAVDFNSNFGGTLWIGGQRGCEGRDARRVHYHDNLCAKGIDWIIIGGESGPQARPFNVKWARDVIAQCKAAGVACFVKQLGANPVADSASASDTFFIPELDSKGGNWDVWPEELRVRQFPALANAEVAR